MTFEPIRRSSKRISGEDKLENNALLQVEEIVSGYGKKEILHGVSLEVRPNEIVTLIGPNGAGKSTVLKTITGFLPLGKGRVVFAGEEISNLKTHLIIKRGISFGLQGRTVFPDMTVSEHLDMGAWLLQDEEKREAQERVYQLFPRLAERRRQKARTMSGGERQMLSLARAMMLEPRLLILDEPSLGLSPKLVDEVFEKIEEIHAGGTPVLMVEQNAAKALKSSDRGYVLQMGVKRFEGRSQDLLNDAQVRRLYLGG